MTSSPQALSPRRQKLLDTIGALLPSHMVEAGITVKAVTDLVGEINIHIPAKAESHYTTLVRFLRDHPALSFKTLIDVCGIDYSTHAKRVCYPTRYAVVSHFLSVEHNWRVRIIVECADDNYPVVDSLTPVHPSADWFEREAFDLYGIAFREHEDLRRILTDYGFIGHPFRKDFPVSGFVEMRFDPEQHRVIYEPVSIERRDLKPREVREEAFGGLVKPTTNQLPPPPAPPVPPTPAKN